MFSKFRGLFTGRGGFGSSMFRSGEFGDKVTKGVRLDGVDDYINFGNVLDVNNSSLTLAFWLRRNSIQAGGSPHFISKGQGSVGNPGYSFFASAATDVRFRVSDGTTVSQLTTITGSQQFHKLTDTFYSIVISSVSSTINLYVNGVTAGTAVSYSAATSLTNAKNLYFGVSSGLGNPLSATIFKCMAWTIALTSAQMLSVYRGGVLTSGLAAIWDFNNIIGNTIVDSVGGLNATIVGGVETVITHNHQNYLF